MAAIIQLNSEDYIYTGKKMIAASIFEVEKERFLKIEIEPHYGFKHRLFVSQIEINLENHQKLLDHFDLCWDVGFHFFLDLLIRTDEDGIDNSIIYIENKKDHALIKFDFEKYVSRQRQLVKDIPLPPCENREDLLDNGRLLQAIGQTILKELLKHEEDSS